MNKDNEPNLVRNYLIRNDVSEYEFIEHAPVKTMADVYQVIQASPATMIKSVLLKTPTSFLLCGIPAEQLVNFKQIALMLGVSRSKLSFGAAEVVKDVTGFESGALAPFSVLSAPITVWIDVSFREFEYVYCGAGTHFHTLKIKTSELDKLAVEWKKLV